MIAPAPSQKERPLSEWARTISRVLRSLLAQHFAWALLRPYCTRAGLGAWLRLEPAGRCCASYALTRALRLAIGLHGISPYGYHPHGTLANFHYPQVRVSYKKARPHMWPR